MILICRSTSHCTFSICAEYGVSQDLANYMLLVMKPNIGLFIDFVVDYFGPVFSDRLSLLDEELKAKMDEKGFKELSQFFRALAIKYCKNSF